MRNDRHWIYSTTLAMLLALTVISVHANTASAHEGHLWYIGLTVPVERVNASYDKTVDNTQASNPRRGQVLQDNDSDDTFAYGIGFLVGHRIPLLTKEDGFYLSAELDLAFHGGRRRDSFREWETPPDAINPAKAGRTAGPLRKTGATASRSSWAAVPACCGHGTRASTSSEASASSRRSFRITIGAACMS